MSFAAVRRMGSAAAWAVGVTLLIAAGCSGQGEGERCNAAKNDNGDCDEGLVCVTSDRLQDSAIGDRCCAPEGAAIGDARCTRKTGTSIPATGGASSGGASSGSGGRVSSGGSSTAQGGETDASGGTPESGTAGMNASGAGAD